MFALLATSLLTLSPGALAWGSLGHETVGYIAQNYVSEETKTFCQDILGNKSDSYLADVATWADTYRREKGGTFSAPFHYIDAEDSPPQTCNVDYQRDCGDEGCVISAIQNYTTRVQDKSLADDQRNDALKFIVHFLGDIHQPLHDEALEVGGNKINVTFAGDETNLHSIWDTAIPEKLVGGGKESDALTWSKNLTKAIDGGVFKDEKAAWLGGMSLNDSVASSMIWARDTNAFVCSKVMPDGVNAVETGDLADAYYNSVIDTVELQIAKAGYRLAGWLNLIATGEIGLDVAQNATLHLPNTFMSRGSKPNMYSAAKLARREFGSDCHCDKH